MHVRIVESRQHELAFCIDYARPLLVAGEFLYFLSSFPRR